MLTNAKHDNYLDSITSVFEQITHFFNFKTIAGILTGWYSFFFYAPHFQLVEALIALIVFDFVTGIIASKKHKNQIKSRLIIRTPFKIFVYLLLISGAHLTELIIFGVDGEFRVMEKVMIGFLAATELVSILENAGRMGYAIPQQILNQLENITGKHSHEHKA